MLLRVRRMNSGLRVHSPSISDQNIGDQNIGNHPYKRCLSPAHEILDSPIGCDSTIVCLTLFLQVT
jgi:hypothetical protein